MKAILKISFYLFSIILFVSCNSKQPSKTVTKFGEISVVTPTDFKEKSQGEVIVDIRTQKEFFDGHIENAVNINYFDKNFLAEITKFDKEKSIFIYCRSGKRSSSASEKISNLGFKSVYDLQGGIINWAKNNQKIVK